MKASKKLRGHAFGLLGLLAVQYVLGMLSNLYVSFPANANDWGNWHYAEKQLLLVSHIAVGMLLLFGMLALWIRGARAKDRAWKIAGATGFGSITCAVISGSEFISTQNQLLSFSMSFFFLVAVAALGWGIYQSKS